MRPMAIVTLGAIIGIIGGMYVTIHTILLFFVGIFIILLLLQKSGWRYLKVIITIPMILLFSFSSVLFFGYTKYLQDRYQSIQEGETGEIIATIKSEPIEKEYVFSYIAEVQKLQGRKKISFQLYVKKDKKNMVFSYGDILKLTGELALPEEARNEGGFSQSQYFKSKGLYGTIYAAGKVEKIGESSRNW